MGLYRSIVLGAYLEIPKVSQIKFQMKCRRSKSGVDYPAEYLYSPLTNEKLDLVYEKLTTPISYNEDKLEDILSKIFHNIEVFSDEFRCENNVENTHNDIWVSNQLETFWKRDDDVNYYRELKSIFIKQELNKFYDYHKDILICIEKLLGLGDVRKYIKFGIIDTES